MHGKIRTKTWTMINSTIYPGDTSFEVIDSIDWEEGEEIVVASTNYNHWDAEKRKITSVSGNLVTVDHPFNVLHYGGI